MCNVYYIDEISFFIKVICRIESENGDKSPIESFNKWCMTYRVLYAVPYVI